MYFSYLNKKQNLILTLNAGFSSDAGTIDRRRNRNWIDVRRNNVRIEKGHRRQRQKEQRQNYSFGMIQFEWKLGKTSENKNVIWNLNRRCENNNRKPFSSNKACFKACFKSFVVNPSFHDVRTRSLRNTIDSKMSENKNVRLRNTIDYKVTEDKFCSLLSTQSLAEMDSRAWLVSGAHISSRLRIGLGAVHSMNTALALMVTTQLTPSALHPANRRQ